MPKTKSRQPSTSDSDSGPDDRVPVKKSKAAEKPSKPVEKPAKPSGGDGDSDELTWDLGSNRLVKLTEFKGKWYVNIREFYMANDGELKPGKKGIMLTMGQWQKFKSFLPDIEEAVKKNV